MKPYGINKKKLSWFDYTRFHRSRRQGESAHRSKKTKRRVKKTLKTRGRRWDAAIAAITENLKIN